MYSIFSVENDWTGDTRKNHTCYRTRRVMLVVRHLKNCLNNVINATQTDEQFSLQITHILTTIESINQWIATEPTNEQLLNDIIY